MVVSVGVSVEISQWIEPAIGMLIWHLVPAQGNGTTAVTSQVINSTIQISSPSTMYLHIYAMMHANHEG